MKLIGFTGGMGVGKSTAIGIIEELFPDKQVLLIKFAQPLYDIQEFIYERISSVIKRDADFKKDRKLLQWLGTDWGRDSISETLWVDIWKEQASGWRDNTIVVCDDVRFDNEALAVRSLGGIIIKITRENNTKYAEGGVGIAAHKSESGVEHLDYIINNDGNLDYLRSQLFSCLSEKSLDSLDLLRHS